MQGKELPWTFGAWGNDIERQDHMLSATGYLALGYGDAAVEGGTAKRSQTRSNTWPEVDRTVPGITPSQPFEGYKALPAM